MKFPYLSLLLLFAGCATYEPRWTPDDVSPPPWTLAPTPADVPAPTPEEPPAPPAEAAEEGNPVPLTIADAVVIAFDNNRTIAVAELDPQIASTTISEARAEFDPGVSASLRAGRNTQRIFTDPGLGGGTTIVPEGIEIPDGVEIPEGGGILEALLEELGVDLGEEEEADGAVDAQAVVDQAQAAIESVDSARALLDNGATTARSNDVTAVVAGAQRFSTGTQVTVSADYTGVTNNLSDDVYQGGWNVEVSQALLRGRGRGINLITLRQARNNVAISEHGFRGQVMTTVEQVELAYWDLVLARELLRINEFAIELAEEQMRLNQDLLDVGRAVESDVLSAGAERASRQADVFDAEARIQDRNIALIRLLNPEMPDQWSVQFQPTADPIAPPVEVEAETSVELAMAYRPELAQVRLDLANADLDVRRAKNDLLPRLDLVGSYGRASRADTRTDSLQLFHNDNDTSYAVGVEFDTAILRRAEKARYRRSLLAQSQSELNIADVEQAVEAETRQAIIEVQRQWARIGATQEAVVARASQLETAEARYATGRGTNLDVLIVQRDFVQAQIDEVAARVGYLQALTSLYAAEGTLLERRGIMVQLDDVVRD